jgi:hypothetical protein
MNFEDINFPVYRKYKNNKSYFKIINPRKFEEIQVVGTKKIIRNQEVALYPDLLFIKDLVFDYSERAEEITAEEYSAILDSEK